MRLTRASGAVLLASIVALVAAGSAWAHAEVSPPVTLSKHLQFFTLAVPTEKASLTTTSIELTVPSGFGIDSFAPAPGWTQSLQQSGSGNNAVITKVTWTGGKTPTGQDSVFQFLADPANSGSYTFKVRQTYSDGSVVDWSGPESSDTPAPVIEAKSSLGGGTSTLAIVALIVGALGLVAGVAALATRGSGGRPLA